MIKYFVFVFVLLLAMNNSYAQKPKHDQKNPTHWYDKDCCDLKDCAPVLKRIEQKNGWLLITKHGKAFLPKDWDTPSLDFKKRKYEFSIRDSQDLNWHACIIYDAYGQYGYQEKGFGHLRCIYVPSIGVLKFPSYA